MFSYFLKETSIIHLEFIKVTLLKKTIKEFPTFRTGNKRKREKKDEPTSTSS